MRWKKYLNGIKKNDIDLYKPYATIGITNGGIRKRVIEDSFYLLLYMLWQRKKRRQTLLSQRD